MREENLISNMYLERRHLGGRYIIYTMFYDIIQRGMTRVVDVEALCASLNFKEVVR